MFGAILAHVVNLKQSQASYFASLSYLEFGQMPTSRDLVIFMPTTTTTDGQTLPLTHAHRVKTGEPDMRCRTCDVRVRIEVSDRIVVF